MVLVNFKDARLSVTVCYLVGLGKARNNGRCAVRASYDLHLPDEAGYGIRVLGFKSHLMRETWRAIGWSTRTV